MTVYFVKSLDFVKIGYSSKPMSRIATLQTSNPHEIDVLFFMPGSAATEKELHSVFSEYHHLNEWYRLEGSLRQFIECNKETFSDYTLQFELNDSYQDECDWEYWKERALKAERKLPEGQVKSNGNVRLRWPDLSRNEQLEVSRMTSDEVMAKYNQSRRTAANWLVYAKDL